MENWGKKGQVGEKDLKQIHSIKIKRSCVLWKGKLNCEGIRPGKRGPRLSPSSYLSSHWQNKSERFLQSTRNGFLTYHLKGRYVPMCFNNMLPWQSLSYYLFIYFIILALHCHYISHPQSLFLTRILRIPEHQHSRTAGLWGPPPQFPFLLRNQSWKSVLTD